MSTHLEVLKRARTILAEKEWIRGMMYAYKDDADRTHCPPRAEDVTGVCLVGAVRIATPDSPVAIHSETLRLLRRAAGLASNYALLSDWNDERALNKDQVLGVFDRAIAGLERDHGSETTVHS